MNKHYLRILLCILAVVLGGIFAAILEHYDALPVISLDQWDLIATIFWSLVPFSLFLFLSVSAFVLHNVGIAVYRALGQRAELHEATKVELETRAAMNDALMWQARHAAKAQRTGK